MNPGGILVIAVLAFVISADVGGLLRGDAKAEVGLMMTLRCAEASCVIRTQELG
jgi:hypothetical protein